MLETGQNMTARHNTDDISNSSTWQPITPGAVNVSDTNFQKISTTRNAKLKINEEHIQQENNNTSDVAKDRAVTHETTNDSLRQSTTAEVENVLHTGLQKNISTTENINTLDEYELETNKDSKNEDSMKGAIRDLGTSEKNNQGISDGIAISGNKNPTKNVIENVANKQEGISENRSAETINLGKLAHDKILSINEMTEKNFESSSLKNINCDKEEDGRYDNHHHTTNVLNRDRSHRTCMSSNANSGICEDESVVNYDQSCVTVTSGKVNYAMFPNILPQSVNVLQRDVLDNHLRRYLEDESYEIVTKETSISNLKENQAQEINFDDFVEISLEVKYLIMMLSRPWLNSKTNNYKVHRPLLVKGDTLRKSRIES